MLIKLRLKRFLVRFLKHKKNRSPKYFARSMAVGVVWGICPLVGQSGLCFLTWVVMDRWFKIRFNLILSCVLTFISNPFTTPVMYYVFYLTGQLFLGEKAMAFSEFSEQLKIILAQDWAWINLWDICKNLLLGFGRPIMLGYVPWAIIGGFAGYFLGYHWTMIFRRRLFKKHQKRLRARLANKTI